MFKNIVGISAKEFVRYKSRYIFIIVSLVVAAVFTIFLVGAASRIEGILLDMSGNRSASEKQLRVESTKGRMTQEDISDIVNKVKPQQIRVECKVLFSKASLIINDIEYVNVAICVYDGDQTFITDSEIKNAMVSDNANEYEQTLVHISESFLDENNIDKNNIIEKSKLKLSVINNNNKTSNMSINLDDVLTSGVVSSINTNVKYDIYISNKIFEDNIATYPASCILEFASHEEVMEAYELLEIDKYAVTKYDEHILDTKSEAIIYQTIFYIVTGVVVITIIGCIFFYMNINTEEHKVFWGILKSVGYKKIHIYIMCLIQSVFIGIIGILLACIIALFTGELFIKELIDSIMINKSLNNNVQILDFNILFVAMLIILVSCVLGAIVPALRITNKSSMHLLEDVRE
ncbi:MAG: ABC transporter permease [Butyrivibrio sp.]